MKKQINEKRQKLIKLSIQAKQIAKATDSTVNEVLLNIFYQEEEGGELEFSTYKGWKEKGYQVRKGEKSFAIWGKPRKAQKVNAETSEEEKYKYWPMAFLFRADQVDKVLEHESA